MKVVRLIGGLGNQMFQYAFFKRLEKEFPEEVIYLDTNYYSSYSLHNGIELENVFNIDLNTIDSKKNKKFIYFNKRYKLERLCEKVLPNLKNQFIEKNDFIYDEEVFTQNKDKYFIGYWQNINYFYPIMDDIRNTFSFTDCLDDKNKSLIEQISSCNSVSIHIRRGDYLKNPLYKGICEIDYYKSAIKLIQNKVENPKFYIFSNDSEWCKNNLGDVLENFILVDWNKGEKSYLDMMIMSKCKYNIIANSSFSWWAAFLNENENKIVIAPRKWLNRDKIGKIQLEDWILI